MTHRALLIAVSMFVAAAPLVGQGPFDPEEWPDTVDDAAIVHYFATDFDEDDPGVDWIRTLEVLSGGDQVTEPIEIGGHEGVQVKGNYLNVRDPDFAEWADDEVIDILVQSRRDRKAAKRFFRKLLKGQGSVPRRLVTDKLKSYPAAHREVMPSVQIMTGYCRSRAREINRDAPG